MRRMITGCGMPLSAAFLMTMNYVFFRFHGNQKIWQALNKAPTAEQASPIDRRFPRRAVIGVGV